MGELVGFNGEFVGDNVVGDNDGDIDGVLVDGLPVGINDGRWDGVDVGDDVVGITGFEVGVMVGSKVGV